MCPQSLADKKTLRRSRSFLLLVLFPSLSAKGLRLSSVSTTLRSLSAAGYGLHRPPEDSGRRASDRLLRCQVVPKDLLPPGVCEGRQEEVIVAFRQSAMTQSRAALRTNGTLLRSRPIGCRSAAKAQEEAEDVFCFLPVRPVGFKFALHASWALTSNREDFHLEDPRNVSRHSPIQGLEPLQVWLRGQCAACLAEAVGSCAGALSLLDGRRVLEPFWRRLLEEAVKGLGDAEVVPVVGEEKLYRPSEVLVVSQALVRCPTAMKFLYSLPPSLWPVATGKRLARVGGEGISEEVAEEDARRLISLQAEGLTARRIKSLLNSGPVAWTD